MTSEEITKMREWSARLMGWVLVESEDSWGDDSAYRDSSGRLGEFVNFWRPDSNHNQTFMVVDRMAKLGWYLSLNQSMTPPHEWLALFHKTGHPTRLGICALDPLQAIILDAMDAEPNIKE